MINLLLLATRHAIYDRRRSWHTSYAPEEDMDEALLRMELNDPASWDRVIRNEVSQRRLITAKNGKDYWITYLPIRSFIIRYWVVHVLSGSFNGLWTVRIGREFMSSKSRHSLFLGRTHGNGQVYRSWMKSQNARYLLKVDLSSFYGSITHESLCEIFESGANGNISADTRMALDLLPALLRFRYRNDGDEQEHVCERGLPIGNTTERFFSNVYLSRIDDFLTGEPDLISCRKIDDIRVYSDSRLRLYEVHDKIEHYAEELHLKLNDTKTKIARRIFLHKER